MAEEIGVGTEVEVLCESECTWYPARVRFLLEEEGSALVEYRHRQSAEGKPEWVALAGKEGNPPTVRVWRRRASRWSPYPWRIGDRVDAWITHRWREGRVVGEMEDQETLPVYVRAHGGQPTNVNAGDLRPSCRWIDGKWVEYPYRLTNLSPTEVLAEEVALQINKELDEKKNLAAALQAQAVVLMEVIDEQLRQDYNVSSPIYLSRPDVVSPAPPPWTPEHLQIDYVFAVMSVKYLFLFNARVRENFRAYMGMLHKKSRIPLQEALDMFFIWGLWLKEDEINMRRPVLQEKFARTKIDALKKENEEEFMRFKQSWISLRSFDEKGSIFHFQHEYEVHGQYGFLPQEDYMKFCNDWHEQINTSFQLSQIAKDQRATTTTIKGIKFYGLKMSEIHEELDRLGVPQREIMTTQDWSPGIPVIKGMKYRLDQNLHFVFNQFTPNPASYYSSSLIYF